MALLDDLRRELENAVAEAKRKTEQEAARVAGQSSGSVSPGPGRATRPLPAAASPPREAAPPPPVAQRVNGRLERERLVRVPPGGAAQQTGPTAEDFRRKVAEMDRHDAPLNALEDPPTGAAAPAFDLGLSDAPAAAPQQVGLSFTAREVLRALVLGEVLDEPKGRRAHRPHRR